MAFWSQHRRLQQLHRQSCQRQLQRPLLASNEDAKTAVTPEVSGPSGQLVDTVRAVLPKCQVPGAPVLSHDLPYSIAAQLITVLFLHAGTASAKPFSGHGRRNQKPQ
jgi:hypothetical protein